VSTKVEIKVFITNTGSKPLQRLLALIVLSAQ